MTILIRSILSTGALSVATLVTTIIKCFIARKFLVIQIMLPWSATHTLQINGHKLFYVNHLLLLINTYTVAMDTVEFLCEFAWLKFKAKLSGWMVYFQYHQYTEGIVCVFLEHATSTLPFPPSIFIHHNVFTPCWAITNIITLFPHVLPVRFILSM